MNVYSRILCTGLFTVCFSVSSAITASADDQTKTGAGNAAAIALAKKSPIVRSAYEFLLAQAARIKDNKLRKETLDALGNDDTCVRHRAGLTVHKKTRCCRP